MKSHRSCLGIMIILRKEGVAQSVGGMIRRMGRNWKNWCLGSDSGSD